MWPKFTTVQTLMIMAMLKKELERHKKKQWVSFWFRNLIFLMVKASGSGGKSMKETRLCIAGPTFVILLWIATTPDNFSKKTRTAATSRDARKAGRPKMLMDVERKTFGQPTNTYVYANESLKKVVLRVVVISMTPLRKLSPNVEIQRFQGNMDQNQNGP